MTSSEQTSCSMFGGFNLRDGSDLASFKLAFDAFADHLKDEGYLLSWRVWQRSKHDGYDSNFPGVEVMIEMTFKDRAMAEASWDYVERRSKPMHGMHVSAYRQIKDPFFVLMSEV